MSKNTSVAEETRVPQVIAGAIIPTVLGSVFAVARFYTRAAITRNWGTDDTLLMTAWVSSIALAALGCVFTRFGTGHHTVDLKALPLENILKLAFASQLLYQFVLCVTKVGICFFYLRIFQDRVSKIIVYLCIGFLLCSTVPLEFAVIFRCKPISDFWALGPVNCGPQYPIVFASAAFNIFADLFLMGFAIPRVVPLKMARRQKISLIAIISLGLLVVVAAVVRLIRNVQVMGDPDLTWDGYDITTWSSVEVSTGIFCASAPCIRPLIRKIIPGLISSSSHSASRPSHHLTRSKSKMYGVGTYRSRRREMEADEVELRDRHISTPTVNARISNGSGGEYDKDRNGGGHGNSNHGIAITKMISVTVTKENSKGAYSNREGGISRFEHV